MLISTRWCRKMSDLQNLLPLQKRLLARLSHEVSSCRRCDLCKERTQPVLGEGPPDAALMFVGEGPGEDEDRSGNPFVGRAGRLLDKILEAAQIDRKGVYITNVVKCRPPKNRTPMVEETMVCQRFLEAQIAVINPRIIVCLGNTPMKWFLGTSEGITKLRGQWFSWKGIDIMPMFHPSYLLRNESRKKNSPKALTWRDILEVRRRLDELKVGGRHD